MEKLMKSIFVFFIGLVAVCAVIETIVSVYRAEWCALFWLTLAVVFSWGIKSAIQEYKAND